jgi:hypothetical protein
MGIEPYPQQAKWRFLYRNPSQPSSRKCTLILTVVSLGLPRDSDPLFERTDSDSRIYPGGGAVACR